MYDIVQDIAYEMCTEYDIVYDIASRSLRSAISYRISYVYV